MKMNEFYSDLDLKDKRVTELSFDWSGNSIVLVVDFREIVILKKEKESVSIDFKSKSDIGIKKLRWSHPVYGSLIAASTSLNMIKIIHKLNNESNFNSRIHCM